MVHVPVNQNLPEVKTLPLLAVRRQLRRALKPARGAFINHYRCSS